MQISAIHEDGGRRNSHCAERFRVSRQLKIETPIIDQVYAVLYEQKKPTGALEEVTEP
mgnify:CR=1 FL=1